ncbi:hypothetical protein ACOME3_005171 [Neoechinorhynchus agilis]
MRSGPFSVGDTCHLTDFGDHLRPTSGIGRLIFTRFTCSINRFGKLNDRYAMATRKSSTVDPQKQVEPKLIHKTPGFVYGGYKWALVLEPCLDSVGQLGKIRLYFKNDGKYPDESVNQFMSINIVYSLKMESETYSWSVLTSDNCGRWVTKTTRDKAYIGAREVTSSYTNHEGKCRSYLFDEVKSLLGNHGKFAVTINVFDTVIIFPLLIFPATTRETVASKFKDEHINHAWEVISRFEDDGDGVENEASLIIRLVDTDVSQVPNDAMVMIVFNLTVRCHQESKRIIALFETPVLKYYRHEHCPDGLLIDSGLTKSQLNKEGFLNDRGAVHLEVEIYSCCILSFPAHNSTDDLIARQNMQLVRELRLQQEENRQLEKKLHALQIEARSLESGGRVPRVKFDLPLPKLSLTSQQSHQSRNAHSAAGLLPLPKSTTAKTTPKQGYVQNPSVDVVKYNQTRKSSSNSDDKADGRAHDDMQQPGKDKSSMHGYLSYLYHSKIQTPLKFINPFSYFELPGE